MNNRQNGRRRGRGGQQARNGQPGLPDRGSRLDNRARGNAAQLLEKYKNLARDAQMQGDRVSTEYYLQFADHYFRVLSENRSRFDEQRPEQRRRDDYRDEFGGDGQREEQGGEDEMFDDRPRAYENGNARGYGNNGGWDEQADGDGDGGEAPAAPRPQVVGAPRREATDGNGRAVMADEGERYQERRPRRRSRAADNGAAAAAPAADEREPQAVERIEVDRLPQGFGTTASAEPAAEEPAPAERPRRRAPRRPRAEAPTVEV